MATGDYRSRPERVYGHTELNSRIPTGAVGNIARETLRDAVAKNLRVKALFKDEGLGVNNEG